MLKRLWKSEIYSHLLVAGIYFFLISIFQLGELGRLGILGVLGMFGGIWAGGILGTFFLDIDHLVYWFVTNTEKEDSREAREIAVERTRGTRGIRRIREISQELYGLLKRVHLSHTRLIFHSAVGQVILLILAFYLLTSGGDVFGAGMIMAMNLHLLKDQWTDFLARKEHLTDWLFWQINDGGIKNYARAYLIGVSLIFLVLTKFLI